MRARSGRLAARCVLTATHEYYSRSAAPDAVLRFALVDPRAAEADPPLDRL